MILTELIEKYPNKDRSYLEGIAEYLQHIHNHVWGLEFKALELPRDDEPEENRIIGIFLVDHEAFELRHGDIPMFNEYMMDIYYEFLQATGADTFSHRLFGTPHEYLAWVMVYEPCL